MLKAEQCWNMHMCTKACTSKQKHAQVCRRMHKYAKVRTSMHKGLWKHGKACTSMLEPVQVC